MRQHHFELYCKDIESVKNYDKAKADNFKNWHCHHILETHNSDGERRLVDISPDELKALGMYYNVPAEQLIFMSSSEHLSLHNKGKLSPKTVEHRNKISEALKGRPLSEEHRKKLSETLKGRTISKETRKKIGEAKKGEKNPNYGKHLSEETKNKLSEALSGRKFSEEHKKKIGKTKKGNTYVRGSQWYNNGEKCVRARECPEGFVPGRLRK